MHKTKTEAAEGRCRFYSFGRKKVNKYEANKNGSGKPLPRLMKG